MRDEYDFSRGRPNPYRDSASRPADGEGGVREPDELRLPSHRPPTHPGEILLEEFLIPLGISQAALSRRIRVPYGRVNGIVRGSRRVTVDTAMRLARFFGNSAEFWLRLQARWDLHRALERGEREIAEGSFVDLASVMADADEVLADD